ncbi:MAG: hypothetical protein RXP92_03085 [Candidatus Micrarchaeota archaeon]
MVVDPNELLIFKLRGMTTTAASPSKKFAQPQVKPQQQIGPSIAQQPQQQVSQPQIHAQTQAPKPEVPQSQIQAQAKQAQPKPEQTFAQVKVGIAKEEILNVANIPTPEEKEEMNFPLLTPTLQQKEVQEKATKKYTKVERESIEAAKDMVCVNHPWRPAYAICNYCKRPFCYADLVEYNGAFYCLEDIDKVAGQAPNLKEVNFNSFVAISSFFLLANAAIMGYFIYPQAKFLVKYISSVGFAGFLNSLTYSYGLSFVNLLIVIFSALAGLILFGKSNRWFYLSWAINAFILVIVSYEYLTMNSPYLLAVSLIAFLTIGTLSYSRLSKTTEEVNTIHEEINWPRVETF